MNDKQNDDVDTPPGIAGAQDLTDREKRLLTFEVAEEAKRQVSAWAKWIVGVLVAVTVTLGVKTYLDVNERIVDATNAQIKVAQTKTAEALAEFRLKSNEELLSLRLEIERTIRSVRETGQEAKLAILDGTNSIADQHPTRTVARKSRQRPIGPGLSLSGLKGTAGTSCCLVHQGDKRFLLTAAYVVGKGPDFSAAVGTTVIQPGKFDGGVKADAIGEVTRITASAALISLSRDVHFYSDVPEIGKFRGIATPRLGERVRKYGRTTGLTFGTIKETHIDLDKNSGLSGAHNGVRVEPDGGSDWSMGGDMGAPVVNENNELVGVHFAGNPAGQENYGIFLPIAAMLEELGVELFLGE